MGASKAYSELVIVSFGVRPVSMACFFPNYRVIAQGQAGGRVRFHKTVVSPG